MEVHGSRSSSTSSGNLTLKAIFSQCQEKKQSHNRLLEYVKKIYHSTPFTEFCDEFERYLLLTLQTQEPNIHANNILEFVSKFVTDLYVPPENKENDMNGSANSTMTDLDESARTNENPLLIRLMKFLVQFYDVVNVSFRLHSIRLLKLFLTDTNTDASVDDELFEILTESLLVCLKDKVAAIRVEAVFALFRLQDPSNKECPVTKQYLQHLKLDPIAQVREAVLQVIGATTVTLEPVIDRTRDEKDRVRKRAYEYLAEKVHIKALTISKRVRLLKEGLQDRSDIVKITVADTLVPTWLKMCNGSVVTLLRCLDVGVQETEESLSVTKLALDAILDNITMEKGVNDFIKTLTKEKIIPPEELSCENSFYWLYLIKYLKKQDAGDGETFLEQMQPELIHYCQYIKSYIMTVDPTWDLNKKLDHQFICEQLLEIASNYDLADMAGSQRLNAVVNDILVSSNCSASLVKPLIACIIKTKLDPEERLVMVAETISNIKEPILTMEFEVSEEERKQARLKIAKIRVELNELQENLKTCAENEEFAKALEIKEQIKNLEAERENMEKGLMPSTREVRTEKNDTDTLLKCMTLVTELMLQAPFKKMFPTLHTLMDTLLINGLHNPDPAVRKQGVLAVGLCSIINVSVANTYFVIFLQILQMDQPMIQLMALKVIFDLLHMHGLEMFQSPETVEESNESVDLMVAESSPHGEGRIKTVSNVVTILKSHLDSKIDDIRAITAQGLGKLLLLGHIYSSELLSHMILLWFNPTTDTNSLLLHFLGVFIPTYAAHGRNGRQCFEEAFIPTLNTVLDAPHTSPLSRVNSIHMAKVILQMMQPLTQGEETVNRNHETELDVQESKPHDRIAEKICHEILKDPDNSLSNQKLSQILTTLYLSSTFLPVHKNIYTLVAKLKKRVRDKITLKNVDNFTNILKAIVDSELTIDGSNIQSSQNVIESVTSQSTGEGTIIPENSSDSMVLSPSKRLRLDEDSELSFAFTGKKDATKKKGRPKRNALSQTPAKSLVDSMMLTRSQEKIVLNQARVNLIRLPSRKSQRIELSFTTTDSDSDRAFTLTRIQKAAPSKSNSTVHPAKRSEVQKLTKSKEGTKFSSESEEDQSSLESLSSTSQERPTRASNRSQDKSANAKSLNRPARSTMKSPGRPAKSPMKSPGRPAKSPMKSPGRPAKSPMRSPGRPARSPMKSPGRPARSTMKSPGRPARSTMKSPGRPARSTMKSPGRPAKSTMKSSGRPARATINRSEQPRRATIKSSERPRRTTIKSSERPRRATINSSERPRRATINSSERPTRATIKSSERLTRATIKSSERPTRATIKSSERPTRATIKSSERPTRATIKSSERPTRATIKSSERPTRATIKSSERPTRATIKSSERPTRATIKSSERPTRATIKSSERPTRATIKSSERPTIATIKSSERPTIATIKSSERPTIATIKSSERPTIATIKSSERPTIATIKSSERPRRATINSSERPTRATNKSSERPTRNTDKSMNRSARTTHRIQEQPSSSSNRILQRQSSSSSSSQEHVTRSSKRTKNQSKPSQKNEERLTRSGVKDTEKQLNPSTNSSYSYLRGSSGVSSQESNSRSSSLLMQNLSSPLTTRLNSLGKNLSPIKLTKSSTPKSNQRNQRDDDSGSSSTRLTRSRNEILPSKRSYRDKTTSESTPKPTSSSKKKPDHQNSHAKSLDTSISTNTSLIESMSDDSVFASPSSKLSSIRTSTRKKHKPLRFIETTDDDSISSTKRQSRRQNSIVNNSRKSSQSHSDLNKKSSSSPMISSVRLRQLKSTQRKYSSSESESRDPEKSKSSPQSKNLNPRGRPRKSPSNPTLSKSSKEQNDAKSGVEKASRKTRSHWNNSSIFSSSDESDTEWSVVGRRSSGSRRSMT